MEQIISSGITSDDIIVWIAIAVIVIAAIEKVVGKIYPHLEKNWKRNQKLDTNDEDLRKDVDDLKRQFEELTTKVNRDFYSIKEVKERSDRLDKMTNDMVREMELLMRSSLAMLKGMQEIGANGPTKEAQSELENYLTSKAHTTN